VPASLTAWVPVQGELLVLDELLVPDAAGPQELDAAGPLDEVEPREPDGTEPTELDEKESRVQGEPALLALAEKE
jgi:hypothetical protein